MYKQKILKMFEKISYIIFISTFTYSIYAYSFNIGLFDNFEIQIIGNHYIETSFIENEIYPQISSSLLSMNLNDIKNKLELMDYIQTVQISPILPNILTIYIVERSPVVLMKKADEITFIDQEGILLPANKKSISTFPVPVLSIMDINELVNDSTEHISQFFQFLLSEYPTFYDNLSEIIIQFGIWEFHSDYNTKIYAYEADLINQINILQEFEKTIYPIRNLYDYSYIDLRIDKQIIVKEKYRKG